MTFYDLLSGPKGLAAGLRAFFASHLHTAWCTWSNVRSISRTAPCTV